MVKPPATANMIGAWISTSIPEIAMETDSATGRYLSRVLSRDVEWALGR